MLSVNLARVRPSPDTREAGRSTGIDKAPTREAVMVRAPGPMHGGLGSGLVGDTIGNHKVHGGDDQAVYAYAREDLDIWESRIGRSLTNGMFGENLTTADVEVTRGHRRTLEGRRRWTGARGLRTPHTPPDLPGLP